MDPSFSLESTRAGLCGIADLFGDHPWFAVHSSSEIGSQASRSATLDAGSRHGLARKIRNRTAVLVIKITLWQSGFQRFIHWA